MRRLLGRPAILEGTEPAAPAYELHPQVALRPESFGALAYHYGNRRLTFIKSPELVELLNALDERPSALDAAFCACGIDPGRWPAFSKALASLEESDVIRATSAD